MNPNEIGDKAKHNSIFVRVGISLYQILAISSMILGNSVAITQTSMKRMLAYSSISQIGYLMIGIIAGDHNGYAN
ncbi:unnamed protein product [Sphagnum jensenii]|uniref:NADH:quinone oxidoreductase/Mrp antiporter transmembrane domain-containing protein n=1 Tax=Sphagnum jensenii TaxID=128206 RepID=A0ABP0ZXP1_9BRYO